MIPQRWTCWPRPGSWRVSHTTLPGSALRTTGIAEVPGRVQQGMTDAFDSGEASYTSNGWRIPPMDIGDYGTEYPLRAVIAREGLGANLPEDAVYASTSVDADGEPLIGGRNYAIDLPVDMPVNAFWSITAYDQRGNLLPGDAATLSVSGEAGTGPRRILVSASPPDEADGWLRIPEAGGSGCSCGSTGPSPKSWAISGRTRRSARSNGPHFWGLAWRLQPNRRSRTVPSRDLHRARRPPRRPPSTARTSTSTA